MFGEASNGVMRLNRCGEIVDECWKAIPTHFSFVELGEYVVMPNHVHGIIVIHAQPENQTAANLPPSVGARHASPLPQPSASPLPRGVQHHSLGAFVGSFKPAVTKQIGRELNAAGIWQRNYYEHVIRDEQDHNRIVNYIESNPRMWPTDDENLPLVVRHPDT